MRVWGEKGAKGIKKIIERENGSRDFGGGKEAKTWKEQGT